MVNFITLLYKMQLPVKLLSIITKNTCFYDSSLSLVGLILSTPIY